MIYPVLFVYSIIFVELFIGLRVIQDAKGILKLSGKSLEVMKSKSMTDREKEKFMRTNSLTMMLRTLKFITKFFVIFIGIMLLNYLLKSVNAELAEAVIASFTSIKLILIVTIVTMIYVWIRNVIRKKL